MQRWRQEHTSNKRKRTHGRKDTTNNNKKKKKKKKAMAATHQEEEYGAVCGTEDGSVSWLQDVGAHEPESEDAIGRLEAMTCLSEMTESDVSPSLSSKASASEKKQRALELKRRRNRECMRRARLRKRLEKQGMHQLHATLQQQLLQLQQQKQSLNASSGQSSELCVAIDALRHENFQLRQEIKQREWFQAHLHRLCDELDDRMDSGDEEESTELTEQERTVLRHSDPFEQSDAVVFEWVDRVLPTLLLWLYTEPSSAWNYHAMTLVHQACASIYQAVEVADKCRPSPGHQVLGWSDKRLLDQDHWVHFLFEKAFYHVDIEDLVKISWDTTTNLDRVRAFQPRTQRMKLVYQFNDDTIVLARSLHFPHDDRDYCTLMLVFRVATDDGYVIGTHTLCPQSVPSFALEDKYVYVHLSYALFFSRTDDGCCVRFGGRVGQGTPLYARLVAMDTLLAILRWENHCVAPLYRLTTS